MNKIPFNRAIFWKVFITVVVLVVLTYVILFNFTTYKLTNADKYGSLISALILSYLIHLWLLPPEYLPDEDYEEECEGECEEEDAEAGADDPLSPAAPSVHGADEDTPAANL